MGSKRGRPLKDDGDERGRQQRARNAERQRRARALRAEARAEQILAASNIQPTPDQLQQGESIINLPFERVEIDPTIPALALRIQGITLAQDPVDAQAQRHAVAVEEHERLYHNFAPRRSSHPPPPYQPNSHITPTNSSISSIHTSSSRPSQFGQDEHPQTNLSQFFRTLPARNPFNPAQHVEHAHPGTSRSPTDDQSIHPHQDENNIENNWDDSEEFHDPADGRKPSSDREQSPRPEIHHQSPHSLSHSQRSSPTLDHNRDPVQHEGSRAGQVSSHPRLEKTLLSRIGRYIINSIQTATTSLIQIPIPIDISAPALKKMRSLHLTTPWINYINSFYWVITAARMSNIKNGYSDIWTPPRMIIMD